MRDKTWHQTMEKPVDQNLKTKNPRLEKEKKNQTPYHKFNYRERDILT